MVLAQTTPAWVRVPMVTPASTTNSLPDVFPSVRNSESRLPRVRASGYVKQSEEEKNRGRKKLGQY